MTADPKLTEHEFSRRSAQVVALMYDSLDFAIFSTIIILHFSFLFVPGLYALYLLSLHVTPLSRPKYIWYVCVCGLSAVGEFLALCQIRTKKKYQTWFAVSQQLVSG